MQLHAAFILCMLHSKNHCCVVGEVPPLSPGAIAASVVVPGAFVLLVVGCIIFGVYYRRKKKREMEIRIMRYIQLAC